MKRPKASKRNRSDEPDAFRRAIERWTLRMLLIIVTVVLAFELVAWAAQKIRRCTHEIMDDADTQALNSLSLRTNTADDGHVRNPEGSGGTFPGH